jgi:Protein of unknown function (DUF1573)/Abnormal spindle-like microcephaly-assoc'd, ASPM-SPD-2-Hydin
MRTLGCLYFWFRTVLQAAELHQRAKVFVIGSAVALTLLSSAAITKAQGRLTLTPETVDFDAVAIGQSEAADITIRNSGSSKVVFSKETMEGVEFNLSGFALPLTLEAGEAVTITVQFYPRSFGKVSGSVEFESDAANGNVYVPLSGTGITIGAGQAEGSAGAVRTASVGAGAEPTEVPVSGTNAAAEGTPAGTSAGSNASLAETAASGTKSNVAGRPTARMNATTSTETATGIKLVQHGSTDNGSATTSSVVVTLKGVGSGHLLTCSLTYGNSGGTSLSVSDSVNGKWLVASPTHFDSTIVQTTAQFYLANSKAGNTTITGKPASPFAWGAMNCQEWSGVATANPLGQNTQHDGTTANPSSGSVTTTGAGELILGDLDNVASPAAGSGFTFINNAPATWLASEYQIQKAAGAVAGNWQAAAARWTAQVATFKAASAATGAAGSTSITATPSSATFDNVPVGATNTQTIQLTNSGSNSAVISSVSSEGTGFATSGLATPLTVAAGGTSRFNVTFSPTSTATEAGILTLTVSGASTVTIPLVGHAVADTRVLTASQTSVSFGNIAEGSSSSSKVSLTNTGNSNVIVSSVSTSGTGFSATGVGSGTTIAPGQAAVLSIEFAPKSSGSVTGSVKISSNATNASTTTISITGNGTTATATSVLLAWGASSSSGVVGYNVYRSSVSGGPYTKLVSSPVSGTSYTDDTVQSGDYYYVVTSVGAGGAESAYSNQVVVDVP